MLQPMVASFSERNDLNIEDYQLIISIYIFKCKYVIFV